MFSVLSRQAPPRAAIRRGGLLHPSGAGGHVVGGTSHKPAVHAGSRQIPKWGGGSISSPGVGGRRAGLGRSAVCVCVWEVRSQVRTAGAQWACGRAYTPRKRAIPHPARRFRLCESSWPAAKGAASSMRFSSTALLLTV